MKGYPTVLSQLSMDNNEWKSVSIHEGKANSMESLQSDLEEADLRFPMHVLNCARSGYKKCAIVPNDTDVIVALICHFSVFHREGLEELWVKAGLGISTRFVPLQILLQRLGLNLAKVLPAIYSLMGSDISSKDGTKKAALQGDPTKYLQSFGINAVMDDSTAKEAEKYLVNVVDSRCKGDNFNQLRRYLFHQSKGSSLQNLPPTSQGLLPHLQRAHYKTHITIHILDRQLCITSVPIDTINNGFTNTNGNLLPKTAWKLLENSLNVVCDCKKCARETCPCRTEKFRCSKFCKCSISKGCKNPYK